MCGIMGIIGNRPDKNWGEWGQLTSHRGPEAFNIYETNDALLGHNRLAFLDLSSNANQPMHCKESSLVIVFNGEIYNFQELKDELISQGYSFNLNSDTEVLLQGYRHWGENIVHHLRGMFSFAIWDPKKKILFAARDHLGIKPFFYTHCGETFVFGSEIKLILQSSIVPIKIRDKSIFEYLSYLYIPAPHTAYENIFRLSPGECFHYHASSNSLQKKIWWSLSDVAKKNKVYHYDDAIIELRRLMRRSVNDCMVADVPVGLFLSGGIDSSILAVEMNRSVRNQALTFSIGYKNNSEYDESAYSTMMAKHLNIENVLLQPELSATQLEKYLDLVIKHFDEPYGNPTVILTHMLTQLAKKHVKVALIGDGADELFAGYPRHQALPTASRLGSLGRYSARHLSVILRTPPETPTSNHRIRRARRFLEGLHTNLGTSYQEWLKILPTNVLKRLKKSLIPYHFLSNDLIKDLFNEYEGDEITKACLTDLSSFLPFNLLEGADRMSMANSFELRPAFLDKELLEFAISLPSSFKLKDGKQKRILRDAYFSELPLAIFERKKRGFNPPVWHWLQNSEALVRNILNNHCRLTHYLFYEQIEQFLNRFFSKSLDLSTEIWTLLVLETWLTKNDIYLS